MAKDIKYNIESRDALKRGVDKLADAVKVTMGQKGRNVIIDRGGVPQITKDGVTVAESIELQDPLENMGAQLVKSVASKTNQLAGDGTTTATVLAQAIVAQGLKNIAAGANPIDLKRGIDIAVEAIVAELEITSEKVGNRVEQIATISANNDPVIGKLIATAFKKVGKDGVITFEEAKGTETTIDVVEGMQFERGYLSPYFVTNPEKMEVELENPYILMLGDKLSDLKELAPVFDMISQTPRPLLIIADDIAEDVLSILVYNKLKGNLKVSAIKSPEHGEKRKEMLRDIAALTGGQVISDEEGNPLSTATVESLGGAKKITITSDTTLIVEGNGNTTERIAQIKSQIANTEDHEKTYLELRLAKLTGGVAVIYVGAASEVEIGEKKDRVQDALSATKAAVEEGIVAGGGVALLRARDVLHKLISNTNSDQDTGINIIHYAVELPLKTMMENAGLKGDVIIDKVLKKDKNFGYDTKTDRYVDMLKAGIIDPKKVTRVALENAASVAGMILLTECSLTEIPDRYATASPVVNQPSGFL